MSDQHICEGTASAPGPLAADARRRRERLKARRKLWLDIHLYIGLVAGAMLVLIGLTGSALVFWNEIDEILDPAMFTSQAPSEGEAAFLPLGRIREALEAALPPDAKVGSVYTPRNETGCYKVLLRGARWRHAPPLHRSVYGENSGRSRLLVEERRHAPQLHELPLSAALVAAAL